MSNKKVKTNTMPGTSPLFNGAAMAKPNTSLSGFVVASTFPKSLGLEEGSETNPVQQSIKSASEAQVIKKIEKATKDAIAYATTHINRRLLTHAIHERVLQAINERFHNQLSPKEIESFARSATSSVAYSLSDIKVIPAGISNTFPSSSDKGSGYTLEPDEDFGDI